MEDTMNSFHGTNGFSVNDGLDGPDQEAVSLVGLLYDPPSGWRYGFPRPYLPLPNETLEDTLRRDGYPEKEIQSIKRKDGSLYGVRFIG
jgi:hypothetical protein